jgi:phosphonate transport system substrate-binding protein
LAFLAGWRETSMRRKIGFLAASACAVLMAACGGGEKVASDNWRSEMKQVRFAVRGSEDDPTMAKRWAAYSAYLGKATGLPVKLFESSDYNGSIQALSSGQVDMATLAGGGYANADAQVGKLVAPILTVRQAEGDMGYYSALIVKTGSPIKSLADMKGHSLGYVDFNSTSGYLFPRAKMREQGIDPETYFSKTSFAGGHAQAVMALENGQFDAAIVQVGGGDPVHGFTTGAVYTMARRGLVDPKDFRVVWAVGPIPNAAFVTRTDRPQPFIDIVRGAMAALPYDDPDLWRDTGQPDGSALTGVDRSFYADVIKLRADDLASRRGGHATKDGKPS